MEFSKTIATTGIIVELTPVPDADRLLAATVYCGDVGVWHGVVNKENGIAVGDLVEVYLPDAIVPQEARFDFMQKMKYRVRVARLRGALSEVLIMPLSDKVAEYTISEGVSIMGVVGVTKYVKDNIDPRLALGDFPSHTPKTDEPNYQSLSALHIGVFAGTKARQELEGMMWKPWVATVKYDGTSTTAYVDGGELKVCSRNLIVKGGEHWAAAKRYDLEGKLRLFNGIALQWETVGPGIQGNRAKLQDVQARLFCGFDIATQTYIGYDHLLELADRLAIPMADEVASGGAYNLNPADLDGLLNGLVYPNTANKVEGIVVRTRAAMPREAKTSFKYLNPDYKG